MTPYPDVTQLFPLGGVRVSGPGAGRGPNPNAQVVAKPARRRMLCTTVDALIRAVESVEDQGGASPVVGATLAAARKALDAFEKAEQFAVVSQKGDDHVRVTLCDTYEEALDGAVELVLDHIGEDDPVEARDRQCRAAVREELARWGRYVEGDWNVNIVKDVETID